ncbi:GlsB/YeaQ/YmgE family stress response membrane protein [Frankia sp. Ag45/Mut15]|uniref:GlsB/YeaQ/YmgE family stress response membrane protein n=1 Tax=Frankia umida TaxID=573489 RepID=A0ABT0JWT2_9ACTN|nr:GlsB/YeaQ/YmgE family stress response membrane protein [Frankia umida]MCK9876014.1 GlsB/YeaQ/YmgE family stress response membrane protein [Frankia umida]
MFQVIWIVFAGLVIGVLARLLVRGRQDMPLWLTVAVGIVGALVGNLIASAIGVRHTGGIDWIRHVLQVGVAVGLIFAVAPLWAARGPGSAHHHDKDRHHTAGRL